MFLPGARCSESRVESGRLGAECVSVMCSPCARFWSTSPWVLAHVAVPRPVQHTCTILYPPPSPPCIRLEHPCLEFSVESNVTISRVISRANSYHSDLSGASLELWLRQAHPPFLISARTACAQNPSSLLGDFLDLHTPCPSPRYLLILTLRLV